MFDQEITVPHGDAARHNIPPKNVLGSIVVNATWTIITQNDHTLQLCGVQSAKELVGKPLLDFIQPEHHETVQKKLQGASLNASITSPVMFDATLSRADGLALDIEITAFPVICQELPALQILLRDISLRKKLEDARHESEKKFLALTETLLAAIFVFQDEHLCYVNPAAETITGYSQAELLEMKFWQVAHPDFQQEIREYGLVYQQTAAVPRWYETKLLTKSGQPRRVIAHLGRTEFQGKPAVLGMAFDIVPQKLAIQALQRSEAALRTAFDSIDHAMILVDMDGEIQAFNARANEYFEKKLQPGNSFGKLTQIKGIAHIQTCLNYALGGSPVSMEKNLSFTGENTWVKFNFNPVYEAGSIIGVCISGINIDEQKKTIVTLTKRQKRFLAEIQSTLAINRALVSEINLNNLLEFIITQAEHLVNATGAAVFLLSKGGEELKLASPGEQWLAIKPGATFVVKGSLAELAMARQQVLVRECSANDQPMACIQTLLPPEGCASLLCAPLTVKKKNMGVLLIWSSQAYAFSQYDGRLIGLFADQAALALNNADLHAENRRLAVEQERHRLARELHDSVSQALYSIGLAAESSLRRMDQAVDPQIRTRIEHIHQLSRNTLTEIRERLHGLYPTVIDRLGLMGALKQFGDVLTRRYSVVVEFLPCLEPKISAHHKEELYYIAREALWNAVKHANATQVIVEICARASRRYRLPRPLCRLAARPNRK
jgi:PAS domain S-box-containing protein